MDRLAASNGVLRAGIALKLNQAKRATQSWIRDRTDQATGTATSYAVAAGLFAAAGVFLIAALLVGAAALFRWIEIHYGQFYAFGASGGMLVAIAAICAGVAAARLKRPAPQFPSLSSRLRVAVKANPIKPARVASARDAATEILRAPPTPVGANGADRMGGRAAGSSDKRNIQAGLVVAATLLGWAATRRRRQARQTVS